MSPWTQQLISPKNKMIILPMGILPLKIFISKMCTNEEIVAGRINRRHYSYNYHVLSDFCCDNKMSTIGRLYLWFYGLWSIEFAKFFCQYSLALPSERAPVIYGLMRGINAGRLNFHWLHAFMMLVGASHWISLRLRRFWFICAIIWSLIWVYNVSNKN